MGKRAASEEPKAKAKQKAPKSKDGPPPNLGVVSETANSTTGEGSEASRIEPSATSQPQVAAGLPLASPSFL